MLFHINTAFVKEMFKTIDEDDDNRLDAGELLVMVSAAMETEIGADLQTAKEVLEGARDEFGESKTLFTWSGGPRSSGVSFFCFVSPRA